MITTATTSTNIYIIRKSQEKKKVLFFSVSDVNFMHLCCLYIYMPLRNIFVLFSSKKHLQSFVDYMNKQHRCIKFTSKTEKNNTFSFLDIMGSPLGPTLANAFLCAPLRKRMVGQLSISFLNLLYTKGMLMLFLFFFHLKNISNLL